MGDGVRVPAGCQPMGTALAGRLLLVAGDRRTAAAVAAEASRCGAVVTLATDARGADEAPTEGDAIRYDGDAEADIERAMDRALAVASGLDGLVVALATAPIPPIENQDLESWNRCITRPLRTAFWLIRRGVHELLAAGRGGQVVVMVVAGDGGEPRSAAILEGALLSLARSVAKEYGRRAITCNLVAGGTTAAAQRAAVDAALFLASPAAGFVSGECLRVTENSEDVE